MLQIYFQKNELDDGSKYVSGGAGDDVFPAGDDFLTGGDGSDTFLMSMDRMTDLNELGIVDNSQPYVVGRKEGIYGYDQNRDGVLDLNTCLLYTSDAAGSYACRSRWSPYH